MKTIYFVRHGESEGNIGMCYQGYDTPLTIRGLEQAEQVAERCSRISFDVLVASSMTRAQQTAECIANRTGKDIHSSTLFEERRRPKELAGKLVGDPEVEALEKAWEQTLLSADIRISDGENFTDISGRAAKAFEYLDNLDCERAVVVTHGYFLRVMLARAIFGDLMTGSELALVIASLRTDNTGMTVMTNDSWSPVSKWRIRVFNDHGHLG